MTLSSTEAALVLGDQAGARIATRLLLWLGATMGVLLPGHGHEWQRVGTGWQIVGARGEDVAVTDAREHTRGACPPGMVAVSGRMKTVPGDAVELLQSATCTEWEGSSQGRCLRFDADRWDALATHLPSVPMRFCIDRYEYPNRREAHPVVAVTWHEANARCEELGKRLCTEDEWTFACEGDEALPYPYGYERDADACVIDRPNPAFDAHALAGRDAPRYAEELDRLWRGEASGERPRCRSPFGVYDMTGNVDEWTTSMRAGGHRSILKGGYWGRIRARCRPSTRAHGEDFCFYQQGFRCCADARPP